jgi:hypothetical protein
VEIDDGRDDTFAAVRDAIRGTSRQREAAVVEVLRHRQLADVDVVVFPGWTLVGETLPARVLSETGGRTVVIETLSRTDLRARSKGAARTKAAHVANDFPWRTHVLMNGAAVVKGARQVVAEGADTTGNEGVHRVARVVDRLKNSGTGGRRFDQARFGPSGLMICGEVNVAPVSGGAGEVPDGFPRDLNLIVNPAHTPGFRTALMNAKRLALAGRGILVTVANGHWGRRGNKNRWRSAQCFTSRGFRALDEADSKFCLGDAASVGIFEVPRREGKSA